MAYITRTECCAFAQLRASNMDSLKDLSALLERHAKQVKEFHAVENPLRSEGAGAPTLWCVTLPEEEDLEVRLTNLGFECAFEMPRRRGYPEGDLALWTKTFPRE